VFVAELDPRSGKLQRTSQGRREKRCLNQPHFRVPSASDRSSMTQMQATYKRCIRRAVGPRRWPREASAPEHVFLGWSFTKAGVKISSFTATDVSRLEWATFANTTNREHARGYRLNWATISVTVGRRVVITRRRCPRAKVEYSRMVSTSSISLTISIWSPSRST
jgi:hypothetical protein